MLASRPGARTPGHDPRGLPRTLPASLDHVLAAVEQVVDALAEGHERAQLLAVRQEEAARREFIDDLLHGRRDPGHLAERAERFGLLLSHTHAVAVANGPQAYDDAHPAMRSVERALAGRFGNRRILLTAKDGRLLCVAPGDQDDVLVHFAEQARAATRGGQVAIGRAHPGAGGVVHSYEEALNALDLAGRMNLEAPCCAPPTCSSSPSSPGTGRPWPISSSARWGRSGRPGAELR